MRASDGVGAEATPTRWFLTIDGLEVGRGTGGVGEPPGVRVSEGIGGEATPVRSATLEGG